VVDRPVARAVAALRAQPDTPVAELAAEVGLSERQLRRRFEAAVGYGPKRLGRVFRFQRLLDLIHATHVQPRWSQLAVAAGYADQSHNDQRVPGTGGRASDSTPRRPIERRRRVSVLSNTTAGHAP
jgi:transcriptional regulator GlxA family with amidase domain